MMQHARLSKISSPDSIVCTGPGRSPLQEHHITAHEQLFQDATRRRMRAEEYAQWFPEDVTFHPRLTESSKTWDSEKLRAELQVAVADRWVAGVWFLSCLWGHRPSLSCFIESSNSWGRKQLSVSCRWQWQTGECSDVSCKSGAGKRRCMHDELSWKQ